MGANHAQALHNGCFNSRTSNLFRVGNPGWRITRCFTSSPSPSPQPQYKWLASTRPIASRIEAKLQESEDSQTVHASADGSATPTPAQKREHFVRLVLEGFRQGPAAAVQDTRLLTTDWGFRFQDVQFRGILLAHGSKDTNSPVRYTRYMTEQLPGAVLREHADDDHYSVVKHWGAFLDELVPGASRRQWLESESVG